MKLVVDVMGFENKIEEAIRACHDFKIKNSVDITLVGKKEEILAGCKNLKLNADEFEIVHANDVIEQLDDVNVVRNKKDSSMLKAIQSVANGHGDGVLSAGNSSVYVFLTYQQFGLLPGVKKPGFMPYIPTFDGKGLNMIDVGAAKEVDAEDLYYFAIMAHIYTSCRNIKNPRIGILNIGTEKHKGFAWHSQTDDMLRSNKKLNYIGYVEPKGLLEGGTDVVVTDGFSGNICLKSLEGSIKAIFNNIINYYKKPHHWIGFLFAAPMLISMKKKFDYKNYAGAFVLGLNMVAVKTHGSADYKQFYSALRMLKESLDNKILEKIKKEIGNESKRMDK